MRPEIQEWPANLACTQLAERHLGHVLAMESVLIEDDPNQFLIDRDDGGLDFDTEALFIHLDEGGCRELDALHEIAKMHFFSQLQDCFEGVPNAFGDWRAVAGRVRVP